MEVVFLFVPNTTVLKYRKLTTDYAD